MNLDINSISLEIYDLTKNVPISGYLKAPIVELKLGELGVSRHGGIEYRAWDLDSTYCWGLRPTYQVKLNKDVESALAVPMLEEDWISVLGIVTAIKLGYDSIS